MNMVKKEYICEKGKKSSIIIEDLKTEIKEGATMIWALQELD